MTMHKPLLLLSLAFAVPAYGHDFYEPMCCSEKDCKPVPTGDVQATAGGWFIVMTGETIPYGHWREKKSPDGGFHRCAASADFSAKGRTLCLYVPGMGS